MGTWIKETDKAIYLMEGSGYIASVVKQPSQTNGKEQVADITPLKSWFARSDRPGGMTVAIGTGAPEPEPVRPDDGLAIEHNGQFKVVNDTYFKLSPKNSSELPNSEKVFVKADSIFNFRSYQDVGNYHWRIDLAAPVSGGGITTSWYVFVPHIRLMTDAVLTVTHDTYFKLEPKLSSDLPNSAKVLVRQSTPFNLESFLPAVGDHTQIELADVSLGANNVALWYVYNLHFKTEVNEGGAGHDGLQIRTINDTYFTLTPKPPNELPNEQKVLVRQGTVLNIQYYTDTGDDRWRVELVEPTLGDGTIKSWYIDTRTTKLVSNITLTVTQDTSFKLEPKQSSALPDTSKVLVRQNTQFQLVAHLPATDDHTQVELANIGLGPNQETSWYVYNPHGAIEGQRQLLRVVSDTMLKSSTANSSDLPPEAKVFIPRNTIFELRSYQQPRRNHVKVTLKGAALGPHRRNTWYCYVPDIHILGTEIANHPTDDNAGQPTNPTDRGIPLQFPGFTGTYYSNDPILRVTQYGEPGHFTWGEALHVDPATGNYRRPSSADVIYGIQRIAKVMEDIRKRYGDRPIQINSWYRDPTTNAAVGGASQSRHMIGDALDFVIPGVHPYTVYADLDTWWGSKGGLASSSTFTHIDARGYRARWKYDYWYFSKTQASWGTWVKETDVALYLMRSGAWIERILKSPSPANPKEQVLNITPMKEWFAMPNAPARMTISIGTGAPEPDQWIEPPPGHTGEINAKGVELVKHFEGLRTTAYQDSVGVWTIGYGHTSMAGPPRVYQGMTITAAEAETILKQDLDVFEQGVASALTIITNEDQFSAMVSFAFNVGLGAFRTSTLLRKHNAGDVAGAADEFPRWIYAGGQILPGLERRRKAERALYLSQDYSQFIGRTTGSSSTRTNYSRAAVITAGAAAIAGLAFGAYNLFSGSPNVDQPPPQEIPAQESPVQETPKDLMEPVG